MSIFKRKEKYKETPQAEMKCKCGFPFQPPLRTFSGLTYRRIIEKYEKECEMCGTKNMYYG